MNESKLRELAAKGGNYPLALAIFEGTATDDQKKQAARYIARGVRATEALQWALDNMPAPAPVPARTQATTQAPAPSKPLSKYQQAIVDDPERYGPPVFGKRKLKDGTVRYTLTNKQAQARKDLWASLAS